jgi:hypothetical protein
VTFELAPDVERWIADGKQDIGRWAANGLGILLHDKQLAMLEELDEGDHLFHLLTWANRAGKTIGVIIWHLHGIFYKVEIPEPTNDVEFNQWLGEDYRTLHCAPSGTLATVAHEQIVEIGKGTHPAQRDDKGRRRDAPIGSHFVPGKERDAHGADHMVVRSLNGGTMDFRSTEGGALRLEGRAWRRISWDEWPGQESADKPTAIRSVLTRLQQRASDFDAKVLLTGTILDDVEHIAKEWMEKCEDPENADWWGSTATRFDNPHASRKALERAKRTMDVEDYDRAVMGIPGGVKGRLFPGFMLDPIFKNDLPKFTPPHPEDGATLIARQGFSRYGSTGTSPYTYLHLWDLAIAAAENVGLVLRLPADFRFGWTTLPDGTRVLRPIEGVQMKIVPGSRTLTSAEIIHTIKEVYLPYGGRIVVDTTDAHGKSIHRTLRQDGYPVDDFTFNERDKVRGVIRKEAAIINTRKLLTEGMALRYDAKGEPEHDADGIPIFERDVPYGVLRLPRDWHKFRDQLAVLKPPPDDDKQAKDAAMTVLMGCETAYRTRRGRTRENKTQRFSVFGGGRRGGR